MAVTSYLFGGDTGLSPEALARQRQIAQALMMESARTSAPRNVGEGLSAIGNALAFRFAGNKLDKLQGQAREQGDTAFKSLFEGSAPQPMTPGQYAAPDAAMAAGDPIAARVGQGFDAATGGKAIVGQSQQQFIDSLMPAAMEASKRTGIDPRIIVAQSALETGWGKSAPGNNYFGIKSHGQSGGQNLNTMEYVDGKPQQVADSFRTYGSPEDSVSGYADFIASNPRYQPLMKAQGFDAQIEALGKSGYATDPYYADKVRNIASSIPGGLGGADATGAVNAMAQGQGGAPSPVVSALAGSQNAMSPDLQKIVQVLSNPYLNDGQRAVAEALFKSAVDRNDPSSQLDMEYRRAQIDALKNKGDIKVVGSRLMRIGPDGSATDITPANGISGSGEYGLNPQYGIDANGNPVLLQIGKGGDAVQTKLPEGITLSKEPIKLDAGTEFILLDPITRQPVGSVPKDLAGAEREKATGKAQGEAIVSLPTDIQAADQTIQQIDQLVKSNGLDQVVGPLDQFRPNWTMSAEGRDALARYNQLRGKAFLNAYSMLKGGGQITEVEGQKAQEAMARMDRSQDETTFRAALQDFRDAVSSGLQKLKQRAGVPVDQMPIAPAEKAPTIIDGYQIQEAN